MLGLEVQATLGSERLAPMKVQELADAPRYSAHAAEPAAILPQSLYRAEQIGGGAELE